MDRFLIPDPQIPIPLLLVGHESGSLFERLPIQGFAAPRTVRNLLGESLASVVVVEEHPFVLPTYPPELPPKISPSRARTHQTGHQSSSLANMCIDSNLHNKICPGSRRPLRQKWSEVCSGSAHRGRSNPLIASIPYARWLRTKERRKPAAVTSPTTGPPSS